MSVPAKSAKYMVRPRPRNEIQRKESTVVRKQWNPLDRGWPSDPGRLSVRSPRTVIKEVDMVHLRVIFVAAATLLVFVAAACGGGGSEDFPSESKGNVIPQEAVVDLNKGAEPPFLYTQDFQLEDCTFNPRGYNAFHGSLEPGAYTVSELSGKVGEIAQKPIEFRKDYLVLAETKKLNFKGVGELEAAIVQEREWENGKQIQVSFNWYTVCEQTGAAYSIGEDS